MVRGDGPWYVSVGEDWKLDIPNDHGNDLEIRYTSIHTFVVVVDTGGELRIDDAYWAGHEI